MTRLHPILLFALLGVGCGDSSAAPPRATSCARLDAEVSCRFVGELGSSATPARLWIHTAEPGYLSVRIGPASGRRWWYWVFGPGEATDAHFSGDVQTIVTGGDVSFHTHLDVLLVDDGQTLAAVMSGEFFGVGTTFTGDYVGP